MKRWNQMERAPSFGCFFHLILLSLVLLLISLTTSSAKPIMVPSGKIGPIVPPTPRPRRVISYPLKEPAPVHEYPDPALEPPEFTGEYNSIEPIGTYVGYPKKFGQQLRNPPPPPVGVLQPRTIAAISARSNMIAYQLSLKFPQYKLLI